MFMVKRNPTMERPKKAPLITLQGPKPEEVVRTILAANKDIPTRELTRQLKARGISTFAIARILRMLKNPETKRVASTEKVVKSKPLVDVKQEPESNYTDSQLFIVFNFFNRSESKDILKLKAALAREGIIIDIERLRKLHSTFLQLKGESFFEPIYIKNLPKFLDNLKKYVPKYKDSLVLKQRLFLLFTRLLNGTQSPSGYRANRRGVVFKVFMEKIKSELRIDEEFAKMLIKQFVDARIFRFTNSGEYLMIPTAEQKVKG